MTDSQIEYELTQSYSDLPRVFYKWCVEDRITPMGFIFRSFLVCPEMSIRDSVRHHFGDYHYRGVLDLWGLRFTGEYP